MERKIAQIEKQHRQKNSIDGKQHRQKNSIDRKITQICRKKRLDRKLYAYDRYIDQQITHQLFSLAACKCFGQVSNLNLPLWRYKKSKENIMIQYHLPYLSFQFIVQFSFLIFFFLKNTLAFQSFSLFLLSLFFFEREREGESE